MVKGMRAADGSGWAQNVSCSGRAKLQRREVVGAAGGRASTRPGWLAHLQELSEGEQEVRHGGVPLHRLALDQAGPRSGRESRDERDDEASCFVWNANFEVAPSLRFLLCANGRT